VRFVDIVQLIIWASVSGLTTSAINMTTRELYKDVDETHLKETADRTMLGFGTAFHPELIVRSSGLYIYTASGHRMLDWTSGQMSCLVGHGHPEIVETIAAHAAQLDHLFSGMLSPPVIQLGDKLTSLAPEGLDKAFFLSTGGEANEAAIKMAKIVTGKFEVVGLAASWHGMTSASLSATYHSGRIGSGPTVCSKFPAFVVSGEY
jgi:4-aminobutyrate aminotransferase-like enzyme